MTSDDEQRIETGDAGGAAAEVPPAEAAPPEVPPHGAVRYSRRRVLVLGGALAAGVAAVDRRRPCLRRPF